MSRDPLAATTHAPYGYAGNSPLNRTDPLGLDWGCVWVVYLSDALKGAANFGAGAADVVTDTLTWGHVRVNAPFHGPGLDISYMSGRWTLTTETLLASCLGFEPASVEAESELLISEKISTQMGPRGWTEQAINETVASPAETHPVWDYTTGNQQPATAYVRSDGSYVVVNDSSGEVVQISDATDPDWKPVWNEPRFQR